MTTETLNFVNPNIVSHFLNKHYRNGEAVTLKFQKRDGTTRDMVIQENAQLLSAIQGVRTHSNPMVKVVTEKLSDGTFQFRSIPLDRVIEIGPAC